MKRSGILAILLLLVASSPVRADGPDDQYVGIYNLIQQADSLNEQGQPAQAMAKYLAAQTALQRFQNGYPEWNDKVVRYRLRYLAARIAQVSMSLPPPTATNAPGSSLTNGVPAAAESAGTNAPESTTTTAPENATINPPAPSPPPTESPSVPSTNTTAVEKDQTVNPPTAHAVVLTPSPEAAQQIKSLQDQIQQLTGDRDLLQAKLKEALAAQPPGVDPRELSSAQERIRGLEKENDLLKASLDQASNNIATVNAASLEQAHAELAEANQKIAQLAQANAALTADRDALQARVKAPAAADDAIVALRAENAILKKEVADLKSQTASGTKNADLDRQLLEEQSQIAALQSDKQMLSLETEALENKVKTLSVAAAPAPVPALPAVVPQSADAKNAARIKELEAQRDELQKNLAAATRDSQAGNTNKDAATHIEELTQQLEALRTRVGLLEARKVPYTPEELALFKLPADALVASAHASVRSSSARPSMGAPVMMAEAQAYYAAHDFERAEARYLELLKDDPKNLVALANLATVEIDLGRMGEADKYVRQALAVDSKDAYSVAVLGRLRLQQGRNDEALDALNRAAALDPQNPEIQNYLGITLSHKGLRGPAETALRKAVQLDPNYASAHNNLAVVYATQTPPLLDLARWHYQKALAGGEPRNPGLEKLLDASKTASAVP
jgi:tetratricopeptide (TPR) repeat protein